MKAADHLPSVASSELEVAEHEALLWVEPSKINLICSGEETRQRLLKNTNIVLDGDWDRSKSMFNELDLFAACQQRFSQGLAWQETNFYHRVVQEIVAGTPKWGCTTEAAFRQRLEEHVDGLLAKIRDSGYKTQKQLGNEPLRDEICVGITREGRFIFVDGKHRLAIARILGLAKIPVRVVARHRLWVDFRNELDEFAASQLRGRIYQTIDHPDLSGLPAHKGRGRSEMIHDALRRDECGGKRLLDIGTQWGYMAQQMEKLGFDCVGVEASDVNVQFARKIQLAVEGQYEIWHGKVFDYPDPSAADVVLALNIFHHLIKTQTLHRGLEDFLQRLNADVLIFEPHLPDRAWRQMDGAYRNYEPDQFVQFVAQHAAMQSIEQIGKASDDRPLYKLTRATT